MYRSMVLWAHMQVEYPIFDDDDDDGDDDDGENDDCRLVEHSVSMYN